MFFNYDNLKMRYEPYPIGLVRPLMDENTYPEFADHFPPLDLLVSHADSGRQGEKMALSEKLNGRDYRDFVRADPVWREFHQWIKSDDFLFGLLETLAHHHIDLGYRRMSRVRREVERLIWRARGKRPSALSRLKARFEFSALSAAGGHLRPHTDSPGKIVTIVVSMLGDDGWDNSIGGGLDVNHPNTDALQFNDINQKAKFDQMQIVETFPFSSNQGVIFIKTFNSWHSICPMTGSDATRMRKTLTINIEATG